MYGKFICTHHALWWVIFKINLSIIVRNSIILYYIVEQHQALYFCFIINLILANMRYGVYCQYVENLWTTKFSFMSAIRNMFSQRRLLYLAGICVYREKCRSRPLGWSWIMTCYSQCAMLFGHTDQITLQSTSNRILWYRN